MKNVGSLLFKQNRPNALYGTALIYLSSIIDSRMADSKLSSVVSLIVCSSWEAVKLSMLGAATMEVEAGEGGDEDDIDDDGDEIE